ncbi:MAG: chemotaxis protein CheB [Bdellovibrionia bacterium]
MNSYYLYPGKLAAFKEETVVSTLLGSCVAVALHDPTSKVGGLNHYLLPEGMQGERESARYGIDAIRMLIEECVQLGADRRRLQAKIYGGANVISVSKLGDGIGTRNIEIAEKVLRENGIQILEKNVAGESARTIKLNTATFEVMHNMRGEGSVDKPVDISGFKPLTVLKQVKVLIVDDSATVRTLFSNIFTKNGLEVVGVAADAYQAREMIVQKKPDVITLDIEMPKMSGVMFLEKLMAHHPIPVVMVSSLASTGEAALRSLDLGAVEFVHKPSQFDPAVLRDLAETLVTKVKAAASVNVIKKSKERAIIDEANKPAPSKANRRAAELKVITVGGNAGAAPGIESFIKGLAADTPPVVVSCSTVATFLTAFTQKLKAGSKVDSVIAKDGEALKMGTVYFIPAEYHGKIQSSAMGPVLKLEKSAPVSSQLPSSNVLFKSASQAYGKGVYSVLFGGFGSDGVDGLAAVQSGGGITVVQSPEEAQFPYAPQSALQIGVADEVLTSAAIAKHLMQVRNQNLY